MINILIVIEDINYSKIMLNVLNKLNNNIRFCAISSNVEETSIALKNHNIDIILLDSKLDKKIRCILKDKKFSIFLFKTKKYDVKYFDMNHKILTISELLAKFNESNRLKDMQEQLQKEKIQKELEYLGYNPGYNGTKYLVESIYILSNMTDDMNEDYNLERDIYPIVAKKYHKTVHNVKCNIINSTDNMVYDCLEEKLNKYLGFYTYSKPGPKKIIYAIINKLY